MLYLTLTSAEWSLRQPQSTAKSHTQMRDGGEGSRRGTGLSYQNLLSRAARISESVLREGVRVARNSVSSLSSTISWS